jgi:isochorismate synthase
VLAADAAPEIAARIAAGRARGARRFLGVRLPADFDPSTLLADPAANGVVASYERPAQGIALVAVGEAGRVTVPPGAGQPGARAAVRALLAPESDADAPELRPRLLGGFAFDGRRPPREPWAGFAPGSFVLPRLLFVREGAVSGVVVAPGVDPGEVEALLGGGAEAASHLLPRTLRIAHDFDRVRWLASVGAVAGAVRAGLYEKVVLAAMRELEADGPIAPGAALASLRAGYPDCHLFSFTAGNATFLGASPELLVSLRGGAVLALGLAGSARRDLDPAVDAQLGQALLDSAKDRIEHETVVRALRESLAPVTTELRAPNQPSLLRLRNIQHLATEVTARAADGVDGLALVERLHPTPAVCGSPTEAARAVIESHEAFDRGWYAGPIGWLDGSGDGEFAVALRSALVRGSRAWLFAGAGIMGESRPADELAEIEMKLTPLAGALAGVAV